MFLWSKEKKSKRKGESEENEFGIKLDKGPDDKQLEAELKRLAGVDSLPEDVNLNEGEEDVESELLRLIGGGKQKKPTRKLIDSDEPVNDVAQLTADIDLGDEDVEVDENDPELLEELLELTNDNDEEIVEEEAEIEMESKSSSDDSEIITALKERLSMYKTAEAQAKKNNESSRARRFSRGIKTLEDLLKKAKAGKAVSFDEMPPVIALNLKPAPPQTEMSRVPDETSKESEDLPHQYNSSVNVQDSTTFSESKGIVGILKERLELYQTAEAKAKENGDTSRARRFGRGIKTLENLIKEAQAGKEVVVENIPPVVALNLKPAPAVPIKSDDDDGFPDSFEEKVNDEAENVNNVDNSLDNTEIDQKQAQEENIMDVLSERLQMYKTAEAKAKEDGETSRARRFNRGIKTLQDLIKQATAGKPITPDDIPPVVALNLKPAPPIIVNEEEKLREASVEKETLVRSDAPEKPLKFTAVEDVDVDEELLEMPRTVLEGLEQRARFYRKFQEKAREEGDLVSADRNEKIVRTYLNAIKVFKKGEYVDVEKLPNPEGCPPIPIPFFVP